MDNLFFKDVKITQDDQAFIEACNKTKKLAITNWNSYVVATITNHPHARQD